MSKAALRMVNIIKDFPGIRALNNVTFEAHYGEVLALIGENGAGKSTLMKILNGAWPYHSYEGEIYIDDVLKQFNNIKESERSGISIIYQELNLIPYLSVAENIFLDRQATGRFRKINWSHVYSETQKFLDLLHIPDVLPSSIIKDLSVGKQQMVEIAKALSQEAKIIIFDEPTSALTEKESEALFEIIRDLKKKNVCMIYISHKLDEIKKIADKVAVIRDGETIGEVSSVKNISMDELIQRMIGRELKEMYPKEYFSRGKKVLEVIHFSVAHPFTHGEKIVKNVSFDAYEGEILGIAGLVGSGRSELVTGLFGAFSKDISGEIRIHGKRVNIRSPKDAIQNGMSLVTEDRQMLGLVLGQSMLSNMTLSSLRELSYSMGVINKRKERSVVGSFVKKLSIKTPSLEVNVENLSGGNQQKVVLGKWLNTNPRILILDEPTRGIDVGAKTEIYRIMNNLVKQGVVVIMISSDLSEIMGMSDRILVMANGSMCGNLTKDEATKEKIIEYCMMGPEEVCR